MIRSLHLSSQALEQVSRIKRHTGLKTNNVICRWALCISLAEKSCPAKQVFEFDSTGRGEIAWETFSGEYGAVYISLLKQRCLEDGLEPNEDNLRDQFMLHVHRGLGYLLGNGTAASIEQLASAAINASSSERHSVV